MKAVLSIALLSTLLYASCQNNQQATDPVAAKIDVIANQFLQDTLTASIIIGIYRQGVDTPQIYPYGVIDKTGNTKPDGATVYKLGSVGKTFTATTLACYAVNKPQSLHLNDTINKFFPPGQKLPFWVSGKGNSDTVKITLLNLAMHYSSLPDTQPNHVRPPHYTIDSLMDFIGSDNPAWHVRPLSIQPGTKWIYSNTGFGLLGVIMERVSGTSYQGLLDTVICNPLNMPDTKVELNKQQLSRLATGYHNNKPQKYELTSPAFYGAGGNYSTMNDMLKYLAWNIGLTNSSLNNLLDTLHVARDTSTSANKRQALAWQIAPLEGTSNKFIWKDGATSGYTAFICFVPQTKTGVVVLANNFDASVKFDRIGIEILKLLN